MRNKIQIKTNLLKERLKKENIKIPLMGSNRKILNRGILPGSLLICGTLVACFIIIIRGNIYKQRKEAIEPYAIKYDRYVRDIKKSTKKIDELNNFNRKIANSIASVRSSSAILTELSQIIPRSLTLNEIKIEDFSITLTGKSEDIYSLKDINIFILQLEASPFIKKYSTKLSHALELKDNTSKSKEKFALISRNKLKFTITSELNPDASSITTKKLKTLGSTGLAHRIKLLNEEELLND